MKRIIKWIVLAVIAVVFIGTLVFLSFTRSIAPRE
jgi:hypothetical protein